MDRVTDQRTEPPTQVSRCELASARLVQQLDRSEDVVLICFDYAAIHHHLVQDVMGLFEVEHDVQFALRGEARRAHTQACKRIGEAREQRARQGTL